MYNNDAESYNIVPWVRVSESQSVREDLKLHSALDFLQGHLVTSRGQMWWVMSPQTTPHSSSEGTWPSLPTSCEPWEVAPCKVSLHTCTRRWSRVDRHCIHMLCKRFNGKLSRHLSIQPSTYWKSHFLFLHLHVVTTLHWFSQLVHVTTIWRYATLYLFNENVIFY